MPEHRRNLTRVAPFAVLVLATASPALAQGDAPSLSVRVLDRAVSYDATGLGRMTHPLRFVITNSGTRTASIERLTFSLRPVRDGVAFSCDEPQSNDDRWPATLDGGASFTLSRDVACDLGLPGRYDVEVRGRARRAGAEERVLGSFALRVDPGANPPVPLPWAPGLHGAASGTREMRPSKDPNAARIMVALINGSRSPVTLAPVRASLKVARRNSTVAPCPEHTVDLAFGGTLAPGRSQSATTPLGCDVSAEAIYDVDVSLASGGSARVHVATHSIRVGVLPPPPPRPEDVEPGKVVGGM